MAEYVKVSDDLTIYYEQSGNGETTILFVPGWTMNTESFSKQLAAFEDSNKYRFITYDPRGQGLSSKTEGGHYYQQHGRDLNAFINALGLKNIVLGGWSFGGNEVLAYVNQFGSDALKGFVMIDAAPKGTGNDNASEWVWYRHDDSDQLESFLTMGPLLDRAGTNAGFAAGMLVDKSPENIRFVVNISNLTSNTTAALLNAAGAHDDFRVDLAGMEGKVPLLYIVRKEWGPIVSDWAKTHTPSATVSATMAAHMGFWENPDSFNSELMKYLETIK